MFNNGVVYRQTSNIRCTLVGNIIVDNSDVIGASTVSAAYIKDFMVLIMEGIPVVKEIALSHLKPFWPLSF